MTECMRDYNPPRDLLHNRAILVTGAGDGIGRAVSKALAAHGATVILLGRTIRKLEETYDHIIAADSPQPAIYPLDMEGATIKDYADLVEALDKEYGRLDGLLLNAGILGELSPIEHYESLVWQRVMQINVNAQFVLTQACLPLLYKSADASIVFTSSGVGRKPRAYWGAYAVSKAAIEALCMVLADEVEARDNLRVNSINPGPVRTRMRKQAFPAEEADKLLTADEITATYLYLLGPDSTSDNAKQFVAQ